MKRTIGMLAAALAVIAVGSAVAQAPAPATEQHRLLSVVGQGVVRARPDMATLSMGVVSEGKLAGEALSANTGSVNRILALLKDAGIEPRDLQTSGFSLEPVYSQPPRGYDGSEPFEPAIVAYRIRNELTIRIRDLARTGAILDQAIKSGANSISGPSFGVADPSALEDNARRAAMRDALRKGALYAEAGKVRLGPIERIEESGPQAPQPYQMAAMSRMEASDAKVPVESGEITYQAQVAISWRLAD